MKKSLYLLSIVCTLSGFAGVIGHSVSFDNQSSNVYNTYRIAWFAAVFAISGLNLFYLIRKVSFPPKSFWFETFLITLIGISSFISLVCLGYSQEWASFAWILVTHIPVTASAIYLIQIRRERLANAQKPTCASKMITAGLYTLKVLFMLLISLLTAGSISTAIAASYPPTGQPISVFFDGANRNGTLQMYCIGNTNASLPTIFIFATSAHGIVDFYGLQYYLSTGNGANRRVCTHDPLGFGWSQDPFDGQFTNFEYLYRLLLSSNEPTPWHIIGWGGGGSQLMSLAKNHTQSIKSVTFIESYPPGIEFDYYAYQNGLGQQELSEYRSADLASRVGLAKLVLSLAIPWGLMSLFIPISPRDETYYPPERWTEFVVQMWKSKSWISQYQGIRYLQAIPDSQDPLISYAPLPPQIPVFGVYCNVTKANDGTEKAKRSTFYNTKKFAMIRDISKNATIAENTDSNCDLGLPVTKPSFTAFAILNFYSEIKVK